MPDPTTKVKGTGPGFASFPSVLLAGPWQGRLLAGFVLAALLIGGAGHAYPLLTMVLQGLALAVLVACVRPVSQMGKGPALWVALPLALGLGLMALQLVPLPPTVWQGLPGHDIAAQIDAAAGWKLWRPLSLTPDATFAAMLALLPALAGLFGCAAMGQRWREGLLAMVVVVAVAMAVLGLLQVASPVDSPLFPFATLHRGLGVGLFVNRNHQGCFLLTCMPLAMALANVAGAPGRRAGQGAQTQRMIWFVAIGAMALGVVATMSRTGLFLLPFVGLVVLAQAGILKGWMRWSIALAAGAGVIALLSLTPVLQVTLARFSTVGEDGRLDYWSNSLFALHQMLPWGTGMGSFRAIYATVEPLAQVQALYVEHAHNDYLELLLEAGWPGLVVVVALLVAIGAAYIHMRRLHAGDRTRLAMANAGLIGLMVILLSSLDDFPLRMAATATMAGLCLALILPVPERRQAQRKASKPAIWLAGGGALLVAVPVVQLGVGEHWLLTGQAEAATQWAPWLADGWSAQAVARQDAGDRAAAQQAAMRALKIAPLDSPAIRALAVSRLLGGEQASGMSLMQVAAQLGWRDPLLQVWLADQALNYGQYDVAVHALDAVLRQGAAPEHYFPSLRGLVAQPAARAALVDALAARPGWRAGFFNALAADAVDHREAIEQLLADLRRAGVGVDEQESALLRWRLADAGDFAAVAKVWALSGGKGLVGHDDFDLPDAPLLAKAAPMVWRAPPLPGVNVNLEEAPGAQIAHAVTISSRGMASGPVLAQTLALPAGTYTMTVQLETQGEGKTSLPGVTVTCLPDPASQGPGALNLVWKQAGDGSLTGQGSFALGSSCPGQDLSLVLKPAHPGQAVYSLRALRIDSAS